MNRQTRKDALSSIHRARLEALIDEATVDCNNEEEEHTALLSMIEERVALEVFDDARVCSPSFSDFSSRSYGEEREPSRHQDDSNRANAKIILEGMLVVGKNKKSH